MTEKNPPKSSRISVVLFMLAAVLFASLAGILIWQLLRAKYANEPIQPIVVAARSIQLGSPLVDGDLRISQWLRSTVPQGAYSSKRSVLNAGAVPFISLVPGEPVLASHLSKPNSGMGIAAKLEENARAISIQTDSPVALAKLLYPGARVDVLATIRLEGNRIASATKTILQNILVLALGPELDAMSLTRGDKNASDKSKDTDASQARRVVTLEVIPEQAERLVLASRDGKIDFVLRSPKDTKIAGTRGATASEVLGPTSSPTSRPAAKEIIPPPGMKAVRPRHRASAPRNRPKDAPRGPVIMRGAEKD